ncbi:MAG TPA: YXWGXW repeat-containing protein [Bacteroidia bacterium]|jgi:hypothetical protein|nr:YXWGXW repeat-containing protein [Bacteroidia bacterium]
MKKLAVLLIVLSSLIGVKKINAQVGVSISVAPPELLEYAQPPCPTDGYMWSPGYWAWAPDGYYWVPGVWVEAPEAGFLWTPGYWGYGDNGYFWNGGYWGESVGFYGGVCYGYGYGGHGFCGGRWDGGRFRYNTAAWHVGGGIHNTYSDRTGITNSSNRTSFNGRGGLDAKPNEAEMSAAKQNHRQPTSSQQTHQQKASANKNQRATANGGHPATAAKSTVGGQRFNSAGHSISTVHAANNTHSTAGNHLANPVATHPSNAPHANAPRPQVQQQRPMQNRPAQAQQQRPTQNRPAPQQQHQSPMQNRPAPQQQQQRPTQNMPAPQQQRQQAQPSRGAQGGGGHTEGGKH